MITEKDIQTRTAEILADAGFNVVASEVDEGFLKPAVFVSAYRIRNSPACRKECLSSSCLSHGEGLLRYEARVLPC